MATSGRRNPLAIHFQRGALEVGRGLLVERRNERILAAVEQHVGDGIRRRLRLKMRGDVAFDARR
jgi:hypothetical protein